MPVGMFASGTSAGQAIPYQPQVPVNQITFHLDLNQAEALRIMRVAEAQRFYLGQQWNFQRESGDPLQTYNYVQKFVDKRVEFIAKDGFQVSVPRPLNKVTLPYLRDTWKANNADVLFKEMVQQGAISGDVFLLVTYREYSPAERRRFPRKRGYVKVTLLRSEYVFPTWDPLNKEKIISARIEVLFYDRNHPHDRIDGTGTGGSGVRIRRFTQVITEDYFQESFDGSQPVTRPNLLGEVPLIHIPNASIPGEFYGMSDVQNLIDVQRSINETGTDIADTINYQASPVTAIFGARAKNLERGAKNVWSGLPADARIETIQLGGALAPTREHFEALKMTMYELGDMPEGALGKSMPISNTSGVALSFTMLPLIGNRAMKILSYKPGLKRANELILRMGSIMGEVLIPHDVCKNCGGRIVEYNDPAKVSYVWEPSAEHPEGGSYVQKPLRRKKCYHVDPQTMEFVDPEEMRLKYKREYGFGSEIREAPLALIERFVKSGKPSYWDYTADLLAKVQQTRKAKEKLSQQPTVNPETGQAEQAPPQEPDRSMTLLPSGAMDIPEEPEEVNLEFPLIHPITGQVIRVESIRTLLVPTGCTEPEYLDPYESSPEFPDPLPKDEQIEATLHQLYLQMGLVDAEWSRRKIANIAPYADEIERRLKKKNKSDDSMPQQEPAPSQEDPSKQSQTQTAVDSSNQQSGVQTEDPAAAADNEPSSGG